MTQTAVRSTARPSGTATGEATASMVYSTFPDLATATAAATSLVDRRLAACVNMIPGAVSVYRWEGQVEQANEVVVILKTERTLVPDVIAALGELHPYDTPALVAYDIAAGSVDYLEWIAASTCRSD